jgi:indolepyruvate ferredoxin oxidoreductase beta subunit
VSYHATPAGETAMNLGAPMSTNLALLGFYSAFETVPATSEELRATVEEITPERFLEANLRVFDAGCEAARSSGESA